MVLASGLLRGNPKSCHGVCGFSLRQFHSIRSELRIYLLIQLGYYVHCILFQFAERRKKDFVAMFCHHIATVLAMSLSYGAKYENTVSQ